MNILSKRPDVWFTVGPESNSPGAVNDLLHAGATGARLTFSYGTPELQQQVANMISDARETRDRPCSILADLPGEKVRLTEFPGTDSVTLRGDEVVRLVPPAASFEAEPPTLPVDSERFIDSVTVGDRIVVGDGGAMLEVSDRYERGVECAVVEPGTVEQLRGIAVLGGDFEPKSLTDADRDRLSFIAESDAFDAVALSFVSEAREVADARDILDGDGRRYPIVSKIETRRGVENAEEIAEISDVLMVARGDLALYLPWAQLGYYVEDVVASAKETETPWIMATQVVEGIERFAFPTRAEICDLHRWIRCGCNGVLLSRETAFGSDPERAVATVRSVLDANAPGSSD